MNLFWHTTLVLLLLFPQDCLVGFLPLQLVKAKLKRMKDPTIQPILTKSGRKEEFNWLERRTP